MGNPFSLLPSSSVAQEEAKFVMYSCDRMKLFATAREIVNWYGSPNDLRDTHLEEVEKVYTRLLTMVSK